MRVRITRTPTQAVIDGIPLSQFAVGITYALPTALATVMIVEGWAEPIVDAVEPRLPEIRFNFIAPRERRRRYYSNQRLRVELGLAADRRRR